MDTPLPMSAVQASARMHPGCDVYAIPILETYLVYAPLKKLVASANKPAVDKLRGWLAGSRAGGELPSGLEALWSALAEPDSGAPSISSDSASPSLLGIIPSRSCNLACRYCSFGAEHASSDTMSPAIAGAAVEWMAQNCLRLGKEEMTIHFFGGEPLLSPEVVELVIHRARELAGRLGLIPRFELSTNGICEPALADFIGNSVNTVVLSLDGPPDIHDLHRPRRGGQGSLEAAAATARRLAASPAELCLRVCVSSRSVHRMEEIATWLCHDIKPAVISFETLQPGALTEAAGLYPPNPYDFACQFLRAAQIADASGIKAVYASADIAKARFSFCPAGNDAVIVSPDGRISSCYLPEREWQARGLNLNVGAIDGQNRLELDLERLEALRELAVSKPERCSRCFCRWTCAGGCRVNQSFPGCSTQFNDFCIQTRILTACALCKALGMPAGIESLLNCRDAMTSLAMRSSDRIEDRE